MEREEFIAKFGVPESGHQYVFQVQGIKNPVAGKVVHVYTSQAHQGKSVVLIRKDDGNFVDFVWDRIISIVKRWGTCKTTNVTCSSSI